MTRDEFKLLLIGFFVGFISGNFFVRVWAYYKFMSIWVKP